MERSQDTDKISGERFQLLILEAISRGIPLTYTAGEVLWMLKQAVYRERVLLACAAQEPKLLPKQGMNKAQAAKKMENMLDASLFNDIIKQDDEKRKKLKCQLEQSKQVKR